MLKVLKNKIAEVETQMKAKLEETRATFTHPGNKGTSVEDSFRTFLREYLPSRLKIGNGEIIDSNGQRSGQTDVVIISEDHPFLLTPNSPNLFFVEGVCAVAEVKTKLTSSGLTNAIENSCKFKKLEMVIGSGTIASSNDSDLERFYKCPPWFIVAFESSLSLDSIKNKIVKFMKDNTVKTNRLVDAVFVLNRGWIINFGDGKGSFQFLTQKGKSIEGWAWKDSNSVLFELLGWLSVVMPRMILSNPILPQYIIPGN